MGLKNASFCFINLLYCFIKKIRGGLRTHPFTKNKIISKRGGGGNDRNAHYIQLHRKRNKSDFNDCKRSAAVTNIPAFIKC